MIGKIFSFFGTIIPVLWKILKIALFFVLIWFLFTTLNNKFNIFKPIKTVFKATANGIGKGLNLIGVSAKR